MATLELTPATTPDDIFCHPLPTVRHLHKQINTQLEEKNERLRTLVGGSYRQLMGTAETIVRMRTEILEAEELLTGVGKGCGRNQVSKMVAGLKMMRSNVGPEESDFGRRVRAKMVENCVVVVGQLLRGKSDTSEVFGTDMRLVTAAKLLVLSRLFLKSLEDPKEKGDDESVHAREDAELRRRLQSLKRRHLRAVERRLERIEGDDEREGLLQALCAYSLATNSGAKDVMRHFLEARGGAIALIFGKVAEREGPFDEEENQQSILQAIGLHSKTLLDMQALVPKRLADTLAQQKSAPLLRNADIRDLEGLRIDVSERWFGDAILHFTPYIRHDDLEGSTARDMLRSWALKSSELLLQGFKQTIERVMDFKQVVELRTKTFETWVSEGGKARGFKSETLLEGLREVVNSHLVNLLKSRVNKLHIIGTEIEGALTTWSTVPSDQHPGLWASDILDMEIGNGAIKFKSAVLDRSHGKSDAVSRVSNSYRTWRHLVEEVASSIEQLKKQRWDDDLEDIEDENSLERRQDSLSVQDPAMLQEHLENSLSNAFENLDTNVQRIVSSREANPNKTVFAVFILRILREIRSDLPKLETLKSFGSTLIPHLHETLVKSVLDGPTKILSKSFRRRKVIGKLLWEGEPSFPVQPSPYIFKFLYNLNSSMAAKGSDLWSPAAIDILKRQLRSRIGDLWTEALTVGDQEKKKEVNGTAENGVPEQEEPATGTAAHDPEPSLSTGNDEQDDAIKQALFDILVLGLFLKLPETSEADALGHLELKLRARLDLERSVKQRLHQGSLEYWKRTNLMFGLLM